jgi:hypothetical protein
MEAIKTKVSCVPDEVLSYEEWCRELYVSHPHLSKEFKELIKKDEDAIFMRENLERKGPEVDTADGKNLLGRLKQIFSKTTK